MKNLRIFTCLVVLTLSVSCSLAQENPQWKQIESVFGRNGMTKGEYFKIAFPRSDLHVKVGDVMVAPGLALTGWFGFAPHGGGVMVMGDMVLTEGEVGAVESKLAEEGFEITALHNHLLDETPPIKYLHIEGSGNAESIATKLKAVLELTATPMAAPAPPAPSNVSWSTVESILGAKGDAKGTVIQFSFPRAEKVTENGMEIPPLLGVANGINFQMEPNGNVASTGDFVLTTDEVNPVIRALRANGIVVTALHNHMLQEMPRLFMLHFWGNDTPEKVARGLRAALDKVHLKK